MKKAGKKREIREYDEQDTTSMIDQNQPLRFEDLGLRLPEAPPSQVISIRLPTPLLNELKALGSKQDVPYHAMIKIMLADAVRRMRRKFA